MSRILDIAPLRSLVAIADRGGFQRAATALHLSQGAVSQHVRRLEGAIGGPVFERHGRGSRLTADGERLLAQARRILALHDETLAQFGLRTRPEVVIGSTEHAAAQLLPHLASVLGHSAPEVQFRFRIDRGTKLREGLGNGAVDLALLLSSVEQTAAVPVGELDLRWYSAPTWSPPPPEEPVPLVAFDNPCALRSRALDTLAEHDRAAVISAEANQLAGVQAAVGAGLGVALFATLGQTPAGLVERVDLPAPRPLTLYVAARPGLPEDVAGTTRSALHELLADAASEPSPKTSPETATESAFPPTYDLARGA